LSFVVDSSVFVAIATAEAERMIFLNMLRATSVSYVAWPTLLETWTGLSGRLGPQKADDHVINIRQYVTAVSFGEEHYQHARAAYERFRLNGHPAKLNYGDVMSYALAKVMDLPLLFKGKDFGYTDVKVHAASVLV
jgi:ribonuclease VapC